MGAEPDIQQATLNLFTDMGVEPGVSELPVGLVRPTPSRDTVPPTTSVAGQEKGQLVGGATDEGGQVAAVEFSQDKGSSWHPAQFWRLAAGEGWAWRVPLQLEGREGERDWGVVWTRGETELLVRAVDDSYNIGQAVSTTVILY